eukprot:gene3930-4480_t
MVAATAGKSNDISNEQYEDEGPISEGQCMPLSESSKGTDKGTSEKLKRSKQDISEKMKALTKSKNCRTTRKPRNMHYNFARNPKTGKRKTNCKYKEKCVLRNTVIVGVHNTSEFDESADATLPEYTLDHEKADLNSEIQSCLNIIKKNIQPVSKKHQTWDMRMHNYEESWVDSRNKTIKIILQKQNISDTCQYCSRYKAKIRCKRCSPTKDLCGTCDEHLHEVDPFHDRRVWVNNSFINLSPTQCMTEDNEIVFVGRFDLNMYTTTCKDCSHTSNPFNLRTIIQSGYWLASVKSCTYLFCEDVFVLWDAFKTRMPGSSEHSFVNALEEISNMNARHSCNVDGNCKLYRYKSAGSQRCKGCYDGLFIAPNEDVDELVQEIYGKCDDNLLVTWDGEWQTGAASTTGEEVEQINSYVSRLGSTTKHLLPENREDTLTEQMMSWNKRKIDNLASDLCKKNKRLTYFCRCKLYKSRRVDLIAKLRELNLDLPPHEIENWISELKVRANEAKAADSGQTIGEKEELIFLYSISLDRNTAPFTDLRSFAGLSLPSTHGLRFLKVPQRPDLQKTRLLKLAKKYRLDATALTEAKDRLIQTVVKQYQRKISFRMAHNSYMLHRLAASIQMKRQLTQLYVRKLQIREELDLIPVEMQRLLHFFGDNRIRALESAQDNLRRTLRGTSVFIVDYCFTAYKTTTGVTQ